VSIFSSIGKIGKGVLDVVAPTIAGALPGPLGSVAKKAVTDLLGLDPESSREEIEKELAKSDPEKLIRLKEMDLEFAQLAISDKDSARKRQVAMRDWTPNFLAVLVILGYGALQYVLLTRALPDANHDLIIRSIGIIEGALVTAWSFFFGSSSGSKRKDKV
jgi:hypothetical protein